MIFGLYEYDARKLADDKLLINLKSCLEINMPSGLHQGFDCTVFELDYSSDTYTNYEKYFDKCDGTLLYSLIYEVELKKLFPSIKGYWHFKSAYFSDQYIMIGDVHLKDKKLKFCLKLSLPDKMKLYVFEEEYLTSVMFNVDEPYCLKLNSEDSTLRYIKEAC